MSVIKKVLTNISGWFKPAFATLFFALLTCVANAQTWSVSSHTVEMYMGAIVYIESAYQRSGTPTAIKDTIRGTAFLIADSDKVYLVTAKHLITAALMGKNQQLANNSIFINADWKREDKGMKLLGLSGGGIHTRPFVFSSDKLDIAIISFQKNRYKNILASILKQEFKPIPIGSIDTANDSHPGEQFFLPAYSTFKNRDGRRIVLKEISPGKIITYYPARLSFKIDHYINQAYAGAPIIENDKIIGILSNEEGILTNADIVREPFRTANTATAIKSSYILILLKKLQQNENTAGFNE